MNDESSPRPIRPLHDVWLKPRAVFRQLAATPITASDYLLGAAQGVVSWLALCRAQSIGATSGLWEILGSALLMGPIAGLFGILLMTAIYLRLGRRVGGTATRTQVVHVLTYSGVPLVLSLGLWLLTGLLAGPVTFLKDPGAGVEPFLRILLAAQIIAHLLLTGWSLLLQVMGFSEVEGLLLRRAFGIWMLGQALVLLAMLLLATFTLGLTGGAIAPPA